MPRVHATYTNGRVGNVSLIEEEAQLPWKKVSVA